MRNGDHATSVVSEAASAPATLRLNEPPRLTASAGTVVAGKGGAARFACAAEGTAPLAWTWYRRPKAWHVFGAGDLEQGWKAFTGGTRGAATAEEKAAGVFVLGRIRSLDGKNYEYACEASNVAGTARSDAAALVVVEDPPALTRGPLARPDRAPGEAVAFSCAATGPGPLAWAWTRDGGPVPASADVVTSPAPDAPDGAAAAGALVAWNSTSTLTVATTRGTVGGYACAVTGAGGLSAASAPAALSLTSKPTWWTDLPRAASADPGRPFQARVAVNGSLPLTFTFTHLAGPSGPVVKTLAVVVSSGPGVATLAIANVSSADAGVYYVVASNDADPAGAESARLHLTVNEAPAVAMAAPGYVRVRAGVFAGAGLGTATFACRASGVPAPAVSFRCQAAAAAGTDGGGSASAEAVGACERLLAASTSTPAVAVANASSPSGGGEVEATLSVAGIVFGEADEVAAATTGIGLACDAVNSAGRAGTGPAGALYVDDPPAVVAAPPARVQVRPGATATVGATFSGAPPLSFAWTRADTGAALRDGDLGGRVALRAATFTRVGGGDGPGGVTVRAVLTIAGATEADAGTYAVSASNAAGVIPAALEASLQPVNFFFAEHFFQIERRRIGTATATATARILIPC